MRVLLPLLLLFLSGNGYAQHLLTYFDTNHEFSIKYPSNWTAMSPSSRHTAWMREAPDGLADCSVRVTVGPSGTLDSEGDDIGYRVLLENSMRGGKAQFQNFSVQHKQVPIFINSRRAAMIESRFDAGLLNRTIPLRGWTYFIVANAKLYTLTCRAPNNRAEEARSVVNSIAESFFIEYHSPR